MGTVVGLLLLALLGSESAAAAPGEDCTARLTVALTPDVPDASDVGFLSSLLGNHPAYRLDLRDVEALSAVSHTTEAGATWYVYFQRKLDHVCSFVISIDDSTGKAEPGTRACG
jgi:hypothetical protein